MSTEHERYEAFEKRMHEKFPTMFANPYGGFAVGEGWWPIVEALCTNIQHHIDWKNKNAVNVAPVTVDQIKEKFGGLRFYYEGGDDVVDGMVRMAEVWAELSCEECGKPGNRNSNGGWIKTLCDVHQAERDSRIKARNNI
jgi:hypothetical protein